MYKKKDAYYMILPTAVVYALITIIPFGYLFYLSMHFMDIYNPDHFSFVGLENYTSLLVSADTWRAIFFTIRFTVVSVFFEFIFGFMLALLFNREIALIRPARSVLILPMIIAPILASITWKMALDSTNGIVNYLLGFIGIDPIHWLSSPKVAPWSVSLVDIWQTTPYMFFIITSGLKSIPDVYYEAARMDGANGFQMFWHITVPTIKRVLLIGLVFRTMGAFRTYDSIFGLTGGGPGTVTANASYYAYRLSFNYNRMGQGAALCIILLILIGIICTNILRFMGEIWNARVDD
jgi:multiple sugar transport system permease protein